ncbi:hypothetical protein RB195_014939 [Necator americanus]|uniref:Reverse transcriptase domain-containing protein n=1 Tax=Necator americanus TaxID=51031 RepID=A0ABR1E2R4_NECAM
MKDTHASKQDFEKDSARLTTSTLFRDSSRWLCLTFIDLKKAFYSVETETVVEVLDNQGVPTQYIKILRELYSNVTTGISPFYKNSSIIDVKRGSDRVIQSHPKYSQPPWRISSRCFSKKIMMLFVSHAKGGATGLLWHAIGTNGRITGACSTSSKINGSQGDQGELS